MNTPFGKFDFNEFQKFFTENDFVKSFQENAQKFDTKALFDAQQKNIEAMMKANKTASEGYMKIFEEQAKALREAAEEAQKYAKDVAEKGANVDTDKQLADAQAAFQKGFDNVKAWGEAAQKTSTESFEVLSKRAKESVAELEKIAKSFRK